MTPYRRGEGHVFAGKPNKLSEFQVEQILRSPDGPTAVAARFGVSRETVALIRAGKTWRHVYLRVVEGREVTVSEGRGRRAFDDCYTTEPNSGCWLWTASWDSDGYGITFPNIRAHRESYERHVGPIPDGLLVCHKCDTPCCVNPHHLFIGTSAENTADRVKKGRSAFGSRNPNAKLSEHDIALIVTSAESKRALARRLGVTPGAIAHVRKGRAWVRATAAVRDQAAAGGVYVPGPGEVDA